MSIAIHASDIPYWIKKDARHNVVEKPGCLSPDGCFPHHHPDKPGQPGNDAFFSGAPVYVIRERW